MKPSQFITRPVDLFYLRPVEGQVLAHLGQRGRILDLGCGNGAKTESFRRLGFDAIGLDVDESMIAKAQEEYPECKFIHASMEHLPFFDGSFDAVFSSSTLQYVNHEIALQEVKRILKPGGKAVFLENLSQNPLAAFYRVLHRMKRYPEHMTPREHLKLAAIPGLFRHFRSLHVTSYNLTTTALMPFLIAHQMAIRSRTVALEPTRLYTALSRFDTKLLSRFVRLHRYCWTAMILAEG